MRRITSARKCAKHVGWRSIQRARSLHFDGIVAKVRQIELFAQQTAVRVRVGRDAARAGRRKFLQFGNERSIRVKKFFGLVAAHPVFHYFEAVFIRDRVRHGNLVRAPEIFHLVAVYFFWPGPSFRRTKHDHGPARTRGVAR